MGFDEEDSWRTRDELEGEGAEFPEQGQILSCDGHFKNGCKRGPAKETEQEGLEEKTRKVGIPETQGGEIFHGSMWLLVGPMHRGQGERRASPTPGFGALCHSNSGGGMTWSLAEKAREERESRGGGGGTAGPRKVLCLTC